MTAEGKGIVVGELVTITAAVIEIKMEEGRRMCLARFDRNGESVGEWFREDEVIGLGFDDGE